MQSDKDLLRSWVSSVEGLVDFRAESEYHLKHICGSTSLPWSELKNRGNELPPKRFPIWILAPTEIQVEIEAEFKNRDYPIRHIFLDAAPFWNDAAELNLIEEHSFSSKMCAFLDSALLPPISRASLWLPSPVLGGVIDTIESLRVQDGLERAGTFVDLACGSGRDAIFVALRGWKTFNFDHSEAQLEKVKELASIYRVESQINCFPVDVAAQQDLVRRSDQADLVNVSRFLDHSIWDTIKFIIAPGGFIVFHTFMESCTKPRRPQFKLKIGELASIFSVENGWTILEDKIYVISDGRETSWFVARKSK